MKSWKQSLFFLRAIQIFGFLKFFFSCFVINLFVKGLYWQIECNSLTFGTVEMKSLLWQYVDFLLSGGYCCSSFRGRRAPEKPLWLAFLPWDCTALTSCSVSTKHDIYHKLHLNLATTAQHGISYLFMYCMQTRRDEHRCRNNTYMRVWMKKWSHVGSILLSTANIHKFPSFHRSRITSWCLYIQYV